MKINTFLSNMTPLFRTLQLSQYCGLYCLGILFLNFPEQISAQIGQSPTIQTERIRNLDIQHIALDIRFDWTLKQAIGSATITLSPLLTTDHIALDAGQLSVGAVQLADHTPLSYSYDGGDQNDALKITLNRKYAAGEKLVLVIDYHSNYHNDTDPNNLWGSYGKGLRFFAPSSTEPRKRRQIWSMGEPEGNRFWFPCYDAPNDFRTTEIRATVPAGLSVVSNGKLHQTIENSDGTRTFHWKMDVPHANHQTSIVVGEYQEATQNWEGVALRQFCYPDEREATLATVVRLPEMIRFFSKITGLKYPYSAYNQVFVQDFPWGGGHNIGLSTISENMVDDYGTHADFFYLWDGVEAQDLAAQWFGNALTPKTWEHAWLSKSFALYFDCLFTEHKNGHEEMLLWNRQFQHATYLADWDAGLRRPIVTDRYADPNTMTRDNYALRGALVLHMLRKHLGESRWQKAIQYYVAQNAMPGKGLVDTQDFQQAVETSAGERLDWFFKQWVYTIGHPIFEVSKQYNPETKQITLRVKQTQKLDSTQVYPQTEFFQGMVQVAVDDHLHQIWLKPQSENTYVLSASKAPKLVSFDVENTWIKTLKFEKTLPELLYQFQWDKDLLGRRSAMLELAQIYKNEKTGTADQLNIQAAFRAVILGKSYWRLRYSALLTMQGMVADQTLNKPTISMLLQVIQHEKSWNRAAAIGFLGMSRDAQYADLYLQYFKDPSDRVVNAAAIALGKSKSAGAFEALIQLKQRPSWKNQSLISALNGLKELGDPKGAELAIEAIKDEPAAPRWTLATPVWDFRIAAAETLLALGKSADAYPIVYERFTRAMAENDLNDIFSGVLLLVTLEDPRALEIFEALKTKFKDNPGAMEAIAQYENQLKSRFLPGESNSKGG